MASTLKCLDPIVCLLLCWPPPCIYLADDIVGVIGFFNIGAASCRADAEESFDAFGVLACVKLHLVTTMRLTSKEELFRTPVKTCDDLLVE